jgi:anti-sigma-K factor RskA
MSSLGHPDIHALSGAYVVDAVDDIERAEFERHLAWCESCREELDGFRATVLQLSVLSSVTPPDRLRAQVLRDISAVRPLPPDVRQEAGDRIEAAGGRLEAASRAGAVGEAPAQLTRVARADIERRRTSRRWLATAAAVVVLGGGVTIWHPWDRQSQTQVSLTDQVLQAPDAQRFAASLPDGGTATVVRSKSVGRAVLQTTNLASAPSGRTYQMWLQAAGGTLVSAGLLPGSGNQTALVEGDAVTAGGVGLSVEPAGGSPQPTTQPVVLIAFT